MGISKKPEKRAETPLAEAQIKTFIHQGGSVPTAQATALLDLETTKSLSLRLSSKQLELVDLARDKRLVHVSRNSWILEAILEKLQRENPA